MLRTVGAWVASGLKALLPIMVVIAAVNIVQRITNSFLGGVTTSLLTHLPESGPFKAENVPMLSLALLIIIFLLVGGLCRTPVGRWLVGLLDRVIMCIPVAGGIYRSVRKATDVIARQSSEKKFDRVVYVDVTGHGQLQMALVIKETTITVQQKSQRQALEQATGKRHLVVLIPSPPNPTGGPIRLVPEEQAWDPDMPLSRGMQCIMTYGMETPDDMVITPLS